MSPSALDPREAGMGQEGLETRLPWKTQAGRQGWAARASTAQGEASLRVAWAPCSGPAGSQEVGACSIPQTSLRAVH